MSAHVLVVEDHLTIGRALAAMIGLMGARAECVTDAMAALVYLASHPVDLVICDYNMPQVNGLSLLRELRAEPRTCGVPILLCSADVTERFRTEAAAMGASAVIEKDRIDFDALRPWIAPLTEERKL